MKNGNKFVTRKEYLADKLTLEHRLSRLEGAIWVLVTITAIGEVVKVCWCAAALIALTH